MIRIFYTLLFLGVFLNSAEKPTKDDFKICFNKQNSFVEINGVKALAIDKFKLVSIKKPTNFIKYDPYLKLYLIKSKKPLKVWNTNDETKLKKSKWIAAIDEQYISIGHLKSLAWDLGQFDKMNVQNYQNTVVSGACCSMYGLSIGGGSFIGNRYLKHFVAYDDVYYGDIDVKFKHKNGKFYVNEVNPFSNAKALQIGDEIISIDQKRPLSLRNLNESILFAKKGSQIEFEVLRNAKKQKIPIKVANKTKKVKSSSYLSYYGMSFDKNLNLINIKKGSVAQKLGLKKGDRLLLINSVKIRNLNDIKKFLSKNKNPPYNFLFDRSDFQFFVKVEK